MAARRFSLLLPSGYAYTKQYKYWMHNKICIFFICLFTTHYLIYCCFNGTEFHQDYLLRCLFLCLHTGPQICTAINKGIEIKLPCSVWCPRKQPNSTEPNSILMHGCLSPYLSGIKVRTCQQILQVNVSLWLGLFEHDHGVCLPEKWASCTQFSQLNQL